MINSLHIWKESLDSCKDPEEAIVQRMWRKGFTTSTLDNSSDGAKVVAKTKKGGKLLKQNIQHVDGAKYMSYIKVSKAQHQHIKSSMKHNGNGIQPKSLNNVLGNIETLHVQPFEVYEEEEQQRLHEHWLQLATSNLPSGFAKWRERQIQTLQLTKSLGQEIERKLKFEEESAHQGEEEHSHDMLPETIEDENANAVAASTVMKEDADADATSTMMKEAGVAPLVTVQGLTMTGENEKQQSDGSGGERIDSGSATCELVVCEAEERDSTDCICQGQRHVDTTVSGNADKTVSVATENELLLHTVSLTNGSHNYKNMNIESCGDHIFQTEETSPGTSEYPENLNDVDASISQEDAIGSAVGTWEQVAMPCSYFHSSSLNQEYSSAGKFSRGHLKGEEQRAQLIRHDEADNGEKDDGKDFLQKHSDGTSFFSLYSNQDRNEVLQSFFKSQTNLPHQQDQKQTELEFEPAANLMTESGQFPGNMKEKVHSPLPLELRQKGIGDFYVHQNIQESIYSDGGNYSVDRQENLPSNVQDWAVNTVCMPASLQSHVNGGELLNQNWFSLDNQARGKWSSIKGTICPTQSIGDGSNSDQSLFSVLSECNELCPGVPCGSIHSTRRFVQSGSYSGVSTGFHTGSNVLEQTANPLNYLSGHESGAGFRTNCPVWVNTQYQSLEEKMDKPFLRSWNQ